MTNIKKFNKMASKGLLLQAEEYETNNIVVIIRFENIRGSWISITIPIMKFRDPMQLYKILLSKGFPFPGDLNEQEFCSDLSKYEFMKTSLLSSQTGWYKSPDERYCYILPDSSFGVEYYSVIYKQDIGDNKKLPYIGNIDEYVILLDLCKYSPPAILTVGVALASFCLFPFSAETFGIHLSVNQHWLESQVVLLVIHPNISLGKQQKVELKRHAILIVTAFWYLMRLS